MEEASIYACFSPRNRRHWALYAHRKALHKQAIFVVNHAGLP